MQDALFTRARRWGICKAYDENKQVKLSLTILHVVAHCIMVFVLTRKEQAWIRAGIQLSLLSSNSYLRLFPVLEMLLNLQPEANDFFSNFWQLA